MSTKNSTPSPTPTKTARTCSQCGNNGHNSRTCMETGATATFTNTNSFMLFGVRLTEGGGGGGGNIVSNSAFRKSASMTNLSQFEQPQQDSNPDISAGYASDDALHVPGRGRERKRGIQWTEEEHKLFLLGLQTVGKGDWRGIARKFVKTRTPTQVASHAQKYFLRRANLNRRRRRSSLFDITTDTVVASSIEEQLNIQLTDREGIEALKLGQKFQAEASPTNLVRPRPILPLPPSANMADLNLNQSPSSSADAVDHMTLSLTPSTSTSQSNEQSPGGRHSSAMGRFTGGSGDSIISVA